MNEEVFGDIYDYISETFGKASMFQGTANVTEYSKIDKTRRLYTSADYPRLEVAPVAMGHAGSTSSSWHYTPTYKVTCAVGSMAFPKATEIMRELLILANRMMYWRKEYPNGDLALGRTHSDISFGKFAPERGEETIDGWAFTFTVTFLAVLKQDHEKEE